MGCSRIINDIVVQDLRQITDDRGSVMHMFRADNPIFKKFGEVYFSEVLPGVIKAWKKHKLMTQHLAVPVGMIKMVLFDCRNDSPSKGFIQVLNIGRDNYKLVKIPPGICYGFKCITKFPALIANCADMPHDPSESEIIDPHKSKIPYCWD